MEVEFDVEKGFEVDVEVELEVSRSLFLVLQVLFLLLEVSFQFYFLRFVFVVFFFFFVLLLPSSFFFFFFFSCFFFLFFFLSSPSASYIRSAPEIILYTLGSAGIRGTFPLTQKPAPYTLGSAENIRCDVWCLPTGRAVGIRHGVAYSYRGSGRNVLTPTATFVNSYKVVVTDEN